MQNQFNASLSKIRTLTPLFIASFFSLFLLSKNVTCQVTTTDLSSVEDTKNTFHSGIDFFPSGFWEFPFAISIHNCFGSDDAVPFGIDLEFAPNISNYLITAGNHFAVSSTLIKYKGIESYNNHYINFLGVGFFLRPNMYKKHPIDIGFRVDYIYHFISFTDEEQPGFFIGPYIKYFWPTEFKVKNQKAKRKISIGVKLSMGIIKDTVSDIEFAVNSNFWVRYFFHYSRK